MMAPDKTVVPSNSVDRGERDRLCSAVSDPAGLDGQFDRQLSAMSVPAKESLFGNAGIDRGDRLGGSERQDNQTIRRLVPSE